MQIRARKFASALAVVGFLSLALPAAALAVFGAIAVNPNDGVWGKSWNYPTKTGAENRALNECRSAPGGGSACRGVIWVSNECGAVYENASRTKFYYGFAHTKEAAKNKVQERWPDAHYIAAVCANGRSHNAAAAHS